MRSSLRIGSATLINRSATRPIRRNGRNGPDGGARPGRGIFQLSEGDLIERRNPNGSEATRSITKWRAK